MDYISKRDLITVARRYEKKERSVRTAVDSHLIPKARPRGRGQGKGQNWHYPPGTDQTLELLFQFQGLGYRGGALDFSMWWFEKIPITPRAVSYISKVVRYPKDLITRIVDKGETISREHYLQEYLESGVETQAQTREDIFGEALGERMLNASEQSEHLSHLLKNITPGTSVPKQDMEDLVILISTFIFGVEPWVYGGAPNQLYEIVNQLATTSGITPDISIEQLKGIGTTKKFEPIIKGIEEADSGLFDRVRDHIWASATLDRVARDIWEAEEERQRKMSTRRKTRQGVWRQPRVATMAMILGVGVGLVSYFNYLGLDGKKLMQLV